MGVNNFIIVICVLAVLYNNDCLCMTDLWVIVYGCNDIILYCCMLHVSLYDSDLSYVFVEEEKQQTEQECKRVLLIRILCVLT